MLQVRHHCFSSNTCSSTNTAGLSLPVGKLHLTIKGTIPYDHQLLGTAILSQLATKRPKAYCHYLSTKTNRKKKKKINGQKIRVPKRY